MHQMYRQSKQHIGRLSGALFLVVRSQQDVTPLAIEGSLLRKATEVHPKRWPT